jgi:hypothetical protein
MLHLLTKNKNNDNKKKDFQAAAGGFLFSNEMRMLEPVALDAIGGGAAFADAPITKT